MKKLLLLFFLLNSYYISSAQLTLTTFVSGLSNTLDVVNAGDDRVFIVQRTGLIKIYDLNGNFISNFINLSSLIETGYQEQGLLGLAFDPNYATNGFFYVDYTALSPVDGETHISRFKVSANPNVADATSERVLLRIYQPQVNHNGGNLMFGPDGNLYIGMGDGGNGGDTGTGHNSTYGNAQSKDSLLGKILRIDVSDTSVAYRNPPTNPFYGPTTGRDEIWAWGVRNPWRWSFDRWTGDWWLGDVGQDTWEEVDYWKAGSANGVNYGWRCYEGNATYNTANCLAISNYTFPIRVYNHSTGALAVVGGFVYRGARYSNLWGKYYYSDEATSSIGIHSITHSGSTFTDALALSHSGTFVSFGEDKYGELYIADFGGTIYRMQGASCSPNSIIHYTDTVLNCYGDPLNVYTPAGFGFHYQWYFNGSPAGTDSAGFSITTAGDYYVVSTDTSSCSATSTTIHVTNAVPPTANITGADTIYCVYNSAVPFTGTPSGGTFTGPGMTANTFDPSAAGLGYHTVTYSYTDSTTGCSDTMSILIHVDACLSVNDHSSLVSLSLFPNPNSGNFTLNVNLRNNETVKAEITDMLGKVVYQHQINLNAGRNSIDINEGLAKGVYKLKLSNDNVNALKSFIVK
jgi:glucose/arabinose dehydrogenase